MTTLKLKILAFTTTAALAPALVLGYLAYTHSLQASHQRYTQQLHGAALLAAREAERRIGQRLRELQTFAASPLVHDTGDDPADGPRQAAIYLEALRRRFPDYRRFVLLGADGRVLARAEAPGAAAPPMGELARPVEVISDGDGRPLLRLATRTGGADPGTLVADLPPADLQAALGHSDPDLRLALAADRRLLLDATGAVPPDARLPDPSRLPASPVGGALRYRDRDGNDVLGLTEPTAYPPLAVVAELDAARALAELASLRSRALLILGGLVGALGLAAYLFSLSLIRPLNRLIEGARRVARGDLESGLELDRRDEIGYLGAVFDDMVSHLRQSRQAVSDAQVQLLEQNRRLEELTVTDNLTRLYNRRHLLETLRQQLILFRRTRRPFCLLMLDLDHFKSINDHFGHLAGDEVLRHFAAVVSGTVRAVDYAARYGGEEFSILLVETARDAAWDTAERLRREVERNHPPQPRGLPAITVSIGIAEVAPSDAEPEDLLRRADAALYEAKRAGRNRVCFATAPLPPSATPLVVDATASDTAGS